MARLIYTSGTTVQTANNVITTVTTTTVTIITATSLGLIASIGGYAVLFLILQLVAKKIAATEVENGRARQALRKLNAYLNVSVLPLLLVFCAIIVVKVLERL